MTLFRQLEDSQLDISTIPTAYFWYETSRFQGSSGNTIRVINNLITTNPITLTAATTSYVVNRTLMNKLSGVEGLTNAATGFVTSGVSLPVYKWFDLGFNIYFVGNDISNVIAFNTYKTIAYNSGLNLCQKGIATRLIITQGSRQMEVVLNTPSTWYNGDLFGAINDCTPTVFWYRKKPQSMVMTYGVNREQESSVDSTKYSFTQSALVDYQDLQIGTNLMAGTVALIVFGEYIMLLGDTKDATHKKILNYLNKKWRGTNPSNPT